MSKIILAKKQKVLNQTKKLAHKGYKAIRSEKVEELGNLLHKSWLLKKNLSSNISNDEIEGMYQKSPEAGAIGGKIAGAGGGFLLLVVPSNNRSVVRRALARYQEMPFRLERDGSKVIFNVRRY